MPVEEQVESVQPDTQQEQQAEPESTKKPSDAEAIKIEYEAKLKELESQKDKGFYKMKDRYESQINEMQSQIETFNKKFSDFEKQQQEANIPKEPQMPIGFTMDDAIDPESASANYLREKHEYDKYMLKTAMSKAENLENRLNQTEMKAKQDEMNKLARQQVIESFVDLGRDEITASKMVDYFYSKESLSPEALNKYYDAMFPNNRGAEIDFRRERSKTPPPPALSGGQHIDSLTEAELEQAASMNIQPETFLALKEKRRKLRGK